MFVLAMVYNKRPVPQDNQQQQQEIREAVEEERRRVIGQENLERNGEVAQRLIAHLDRLIETFEAAVARGNRDNNENRKLFYFLFRTRLLG